MLACLIDGKIVSGSDASISVMDHGLLYGDGVFEGLRFYQGRLFCLDEHLDRLSRSAKAIGLITPMSRERITQDLQIAIKASNIQEGYIRLIITRGVGALGINPLTCRDGKTIIIVDRLQIVSASAAKQGARLIIASTRRFAADQLDPRIKSLNYLNQIMAKREALSAGADEAIMLNQNGNVAEGSADNVFIVENGALRTPPSSDGALEGITRNIVIKIAKKLGIACFESSLSPYDLSAADECFLSGTGAELIPVSSIGDCDLPTIRSVFDKIQAEFVKLTYGQNRI
jgi:branched-chain amino acid aminotransferase